MTSRPCTGNYVNERIVSRHERVYQSYDHSLRLRGNILAKLLVRLLVRSLRISVLHILFDDSMLTRLESWPGPGGQGDKSIAPGAVVIEMLGRPPCICYETPLIHPSLILSLGHRWKYATTACVSRVLCPAPLSVPGGYLVGWELLNSSLLTHAHHRHEISAPGSHSLPSLVPLVWDEVWHADSPRVCRPLSAGRPLRAC